MMGEGATRALAHFREANGAYPFVGDLSAPETMTALDVSIVQWFGSQHHQGVRAILDGHTDEYDLGSPATPAPDEPATVTVAEMAGSDGAALESQKAFLASIGKLKTQ